MMMDGWKGHPHEQMNSPKLQLLLTKAFQMNDPGYLIAPACGFIEEPGMKGNTFGLYREDKEMVATVEKYKLTDEFWNCEAIHYGMLHHQELVRELFKEIRNKKVLIVAGDMLDVRKWFPYADFISIRMDNAFENWEEILEDIYTVNNHNRYDIVLTSCGLVSQIIQYFMFIDKTGLTTINMGSVFNALLEITGDNPHTRGWIRDNLEEIKKFNATL